MSTTGNDGQAILNHYGAGWDVETLLAYLKETSGGDVEQDNNGQVIIYTGLWLTPDDCLTNEEPNREEAQ